MFEVNIMVQNADGTPLMPTHHYGRAKRMLRSGKARIVSRRPFVIRLTYQDRESGTGYRNTWYRPRKNKYRSGTD